MSTPRNRGTLVHLYCATGGAVFDPTGVTTRNCQAAILAAAVTDDDFAVIVDPARAEQLGQAFIEMIGFVQNRDDYAEPYSFCRADR